MGSAGPTKAAINMKELQPRRNAPIK